MKVFFDNEFLAELYELNPEQIKGKLPFSREVIKQYQKKVNILIAITELKDLRNFRSLNFEKLAGNRKGEYSVRLNKQYRLIFKVNQNGEAEILVLEISKHYE